MFDVKLDNRSYKIYLRVISRTRRFFPGGVALNRAALGRHQVH